MVSILKLITQLSRRLFLGGKGGAGGIFGRGQGGLFRSLLTTDFLSSFYTSLHVATFTLEDR